MAVILEAGYHAIFLLTIYGIYLMYSNFSNILGFIAGLFFNPFPEEVLKLFYNYPFINSLLCIKVSPPSLMLIFQFYKIKFQVSMQMNFQLTVTCG